jgi:ubiquinone/menaquinone biosynthesis C-methylase UbiE
MTDKKFDPRKLNKLNNPQRLADIPPDFIADRLRNKQPQTLVEIGAGTAFFCIAFREQLKPSKIYACDVSDRMLAWVRENVVPAYPDIVPVKSAESAVPLDDGIADLVFMINLHHELDDPALTLGEAYRLLKPGGEILIVDWQKRDMPEGPPQAIRYVPERVREELVQAGFEGVSIYTQLPKHFLVVAGKAD